MIDRKKNEKKYDEAKKKVLRLFKGWEPDICNIEEWVFPDGRKRLRFYANFTEKTDEGNGRKSHVRDTLPGNEPKKSAKMLSVKKTLPRRKK